MITTTTDNYSVLLLNGVALQTADVYSYIMATRSMKECAVTLSTIGTGTPVGLWGFEFTNDPAAEADYWKEQRTSTRIGASTTAIWVPIDAPDTVHGDSLTIGGGVTQNTEVSFVLGLAAWFRVWFDWTSGGSASSLATVRATGKG